MSDCEVKLKKSKKSKHTEPEPESEVECQAEQISKKEKKSKKDKRDRLVPEEVDIENVASIPADSKKKEKKEKKAKREYLEIDVDEPVVVSDATPKKEKKHKHAKLEEAEEPKKEKKQKSSLESFEVQTPTDAPLNETTTVETPNNYWKRFDEEKYKSKVTGTKYEDNSHYSKGGDAWGNEAADRLGKVKGQGFRKEMQKLKRASWKGCGSIDAGVNSVQFSDWED
jgi:hypothetical protein